LLFGRLVVTCNRTYPNEAIRRTACGRIAKQYYGVVRAVGWKFYMGSGKNN